MAIPVIPDIAQVQVRLLKDTGLPEDVFINTWYFRTAPLNTVADNAASIATMLDAFYANDFGSPLGSIADWVPQYVNEVRYVFYDLGSALPRFPVTPTGASQDYILGGWVGGGSNASAMPEEAAICLSYYSGNGPRRRGRVYLGPFTTAPQTYDNGGVRPSTSARGRIAAAALNVRDSTQNATWVQVSPTDGVANDVTGGWVDDAMDTQRRRGAPPTARTTWGD